VSDASKQTTEKPQAEADKPQAEADKPQAEAQKPQAEGDDTSTARPRRRGLSRGSAKPAVQPAPAKPGSAKSGPAKSGPVKSGVDTVRKQLASLVWLVAVVCALFLAIGALTKALDMNLDNPILAFINTGAHKLDFGQFKDFGNGKNAEVEGALVNWGIAAIIYLVVGKIIDRVIRP
jgi:hypothetical protein